MHLELLLRSEIQGRLLKSAAIAVDATTALMIKENSHACMYKPLSSVGRGEVDTCYKGV